MDGNYIDLVPQPDPEGGLPSPAVYPASRAAELSHLSASGSTTPRWGLGDAVVGWLLGLVGSIVTVSLVVAVTGDAMDDVSLGWLAIAQVGLWAGLLAVPIVVSRTKGNGMVADFGFWGRPLDALTGAGAGLVTQFLIVPLLYIPIMYVFDIDSDDVGKVARDMTDRADGAAGIVILILIVGIAAPIVEEIFYRGLLQRSLERRLGAVPGLVATSVIFGISHFQLIQFPALVLAGLVFGLLAQRSGRLGPAIAAHLVFNMTAVVSLVWFI